MYRRLSEGLHSQRDSVVVVSSPSSSEFIDWEEAVDVSDVLLPTEQQEAGVSAIVLIGSAKTLVIPKVWPRSG